MNKRRVVVSKVAVDVLLKIAYNLNNPEKTTIQTNAKKEALEEILEAWLCRQMGTGKDESESNARDIYKIEIGLALSNDTFYTNSDTGNKSLTCGIVGDVFRRLDKIEVLPFSE